MKGEGIITEGISLIDELLKDQQQLQTPVAEFSLKHDKNIAPEGAVSYQHLIPLSLPEKGQQYAFRVDLDKCTGCKSCVTACHNLNGLDVSEAWRDAGKIIENTDNSFAMQQTVTTACHHCDDPGCLNGCPVMAYEKDPLTGIVRHLDDQCIGCQYCVLKCPYDVPKYNKRKGIVRKCDMCHNRLNVGEAPACVQACPNDAITISIVDKEEIHLQAKGAFLPGAPEPSYTKPSTQYVSKRNLSEKLVAADAFKLKAEHAHMPLVLMLVTTQLSVGFYAFSIFFEKVFGATFAFSPAIIALALCVLGIGFSTAHLGRPLKAWKAFLGLRTSWMSREVIGFTKYMIFLGAVVAIEKLKIPAIPNFAYPVAQFSALAFGGISVISSIMLYVDTQRKLWAFPVTATKFMGTMFICGGVAMSVYFLILSGDLSMAVTAIKIAVPVYILKLLYELKLLDFAFRKNYSPYKKSALTQLKLKKVQLQLRYLLAVIGGLLLPILAVLLSGNEGNLFLLSIIIAASLVVLITAELFERYLYFTTVDAPKMPGE